MPRQISFSIPTFDDVFSRNKPESGVPGNAAAAAPASSTGTPGAGQGGAGKSRLLRHFPFARQAKPPDRPRDLALGDAAPAGARELDGFYDRFNLSHRASSGQPLPVITLTGAGLDIEQVVQAARHGAQLEIAPEAMQRVERGYAIVLEAARQGKPVYGLTTGVGQNKDKTVIHQAAAEQSDAQKMAQLLAQSRAFNLSSIQAHTSGMGNPLPREQVRAAMLLRLNTLLSGAGGVQPAVVVSLKDFLNHGITPLIPEYGSIGQGDLLLMGHIGRVMAGQGWVLADSGPPSSRAELARAGLDPDDSACPKAILRAERALKRASLEPIALVGKDFLSIVSTNALTAGQAALSTHDIAQFLARETQVFALCLEGLNGNLAPFLAVSNDQARPFPASSRMAAAIREALEGSYLWQADTAAGRSRAMQDPVSYRSMAYGLGELLQSLTGLHQALKIQINHSDDNPYVALSYRAPENGISSQERKYVIDMPDGSQGAIIPTANFDSTPFVRPMEYLLHSMGALSVAMAENIVRFEDPHINGGLPRFLAGGEGHGFGAVSKLAGSLLDALQASTTLTRSGNLVVAGGQLEDLSNAGPTTARKLRDAVKLLYNLAAMQTVYAAQAIDLRRQGGERIALGAGTAGLYAELRSRTPMMHEDGETMTALAIAEQVLRNASSPGQG